MKFTCSNNKTKVLVIATVTLLILINFASAQRGRGRGRGTFLLYYSHYLDKLFCDVNKFNLGRAKTRILGLPITGKYRDPESDQYYNNHNVC